LETWAFTSFFCALRQMPIVCRKVEYYLATFVASHQLGQLARFGGTVIPVS